MLRRSPQTDKEPVRLAYFDNFKGILISLVVLGHFLYAYSGSGGPVLARIITPIIYTFHMPAFVFISGFFSKSRQSSNFRSLARLASAYLIFNGLLLVYNLFTGTGISLLTPLYSAWYLAALIVWRLAVRFFGRQKHLFAFSVLFALLAGFWPEISNQFAMGRIIAFFPFFLLGFRLDKTVFFLFSSCRKKSVYILGAVLAAAGLSCAYYLAGSGAISLEMMLMSPYKSFYDALARASLFLLALLIIAAMMLMMPSKKIPLIAKWGKNSLAVYVAHRPVTLLFALLLPLSSYNRLVFGAACAASAATLVLFGSDRFAHALERLLDIFTAALCSANDIGNRRRQRALSAAAIFAVCIMLVNPVMNLTGQLKGGESEQKAEDVIYPVMDRETLDQLKSDIKITFSGDLILLMDQVKDGYDETSGLYNFDEQFAYAKKYFEQADYSIGIFEGPLAGEKAGYSEGNYDDGLTLRLNYPDAYASAVKKAGIDFVSLANNHLLDKGPKAVPRTLGVLDRAGLSHTGAYRNADEKKKVTLVDVKGLKIAVLSYTYGCNYYTEDELFNENPDITSVICDPESPYFASAKKAVLEDFDRAKKEKPDLIAVIPHMGEQFVHTTNVFQDTWNDIFIEAGADLVLGDHAHAVQPMEYRTVKTQTGAGRALVINCPGNFVNSYTEHDGDATAITEIYLDPEDGTVEGCSIVPMMTQGMYKGQYRALPIADIMKNTALSKTMSKQEFNRAKEVQKIVTKVMLGCTVTCDQLQDRYYFLPDGYRRQEVWPLQISAEEKTSPLYKVLSNAKKVCFSGDSLTEGTKNGGYGWYEPMMAAFPGVQAVKKAWGGSTSVILLEKRDELIQAAADVYVIAVGTNDVRYRDSRQCAMDAKAFVSNLDALRSAVAGKNRGAVFVFIAPWMSLDFDTVSKLKTGEKNDMLLQYTDALKKYCAGNGCLFVDPNPAIRQKLMREPYSDYLLDAIHPNAGSGIELYSSAVIGYQSSS